MARAFHWIPARRKALLAQNPEAYYLTKHYAPYPAMLVRLARIKRAELKDLLAECHAFTLQQNRSSRPGSLNLSG